MPSRLIGAGWDKPIPYTGQLNWIKKNATYARVEYMQAKPRPTLVAGAAVLLAFTAAVLATASTGHETHLHSVPIEAVDAGSGVSWPVHAGAPLAQGTVQEERLLSLRDGQNRPVVAQIRVTARWPDGSAQWVNAEWIALPSGAPYRLVWERAAERQEPLAATGTPALTLKIGARGFKFNGRVLGPAAENGQAAWQGRWTDGQDAAHEAVVESNDLELNGPIHAVVKQTGRYLRDGNPSGLGFTLRFHAYRDQPWLRVQHTFQVLTNTEHAVIREIAVEMPTGLSGNQQTVSVGELPAEAAQTRLALEGVVGFGQRVFRHYGQPGSVGEIWRDDRVLKTSATIPHWGVVSDGAQRAAVALPLMVEKFPQAILFERGRVRVQLWSPRGGDLRFNLDGLIAFWSKDLFERWTRPDKDRLNAYMQAAQNRQFQGEFSTDADGLQNTQEFYWWPKTEASDQQLREWAALTKHPPVWRAAPEAAAASGAAGLWSPRDTNRFAAAERMVSDAAAALLRLEREWGDFGWWAYGSGPHFIYHNVDGRLQCAPFRFFNEDYQMPRRWWVEFFRGGPREYYDFALRRADHFTDIEMSHRDTASRRAGSFGGNLPVFWCMPDDLGQLCRFAVTVEPLLFAYHQTGDERYREACQLWSQAVLKYADDPQWPMKLRELYQGDSGNKSVLRQTHNFWMNAVLLYETFRDPAMRKVVEQGATALFDLSQPSRTYRTKDMTAPVDQLGKLYVRLRALYAAERALEDGRLREQVRTVGRTLGYLYSRSLGGISGGEEYFAETHALAYHFTGDAAPALQGRQKLAGYQAEWQNTLTPERLAALDIHESPALFRNVLEGCGWLMKAITDAEQTADGAAPRYPLLPAGCELVYGVVDSHAFPWLNIRSATNAITVTALSGKPLAPFRVKSQPVYFFDAEHGHQGFEVSARWKWHKEFLARLQAADVALASSAAVYGHYPACIEIGPEEAYWLTTAAPTNRFAVAARYPQALTFATEQGPVNASLADGKARLELPVPASWLRISSRATNYVKPVSVPPEQRWFSCAPPQPSVGARLAAIPVPRDDRPADPNAPFVPGRSGTGLRLRPGHNLEIPLELAAPAGARKTFDPKQGAIEFWFRPDWDSRLIDPGARVAYFFSNHRFFMMNHVRPGQAASILHAFIHNDQRFNYGGPHHIFQSGVWTHIAVDWHTHDSGGVPVPIHHVYVNGWDRRLNVDKAVLQYFRDQCITPPHRLTAGPWNFDGNLDGVMDNLCISSAPRYTDISRPPYFIEQRANPNHFTPSAALRPWDGQTILTCDFERNARITISADGKTSDARLWEGAFKE